MAAAHNSRGPILRKFMCAVIAAFYAMSAPSLLLRVNAQEAPNPINLDLSTTARTIASEQNIQGISIARDGAAHAITAGEMLTPAEYVAATEILSGREQTLVIDAAGRAVGGTAVLTPAVANLISALVVPAGVLLVRDFAFGGALNLTGDLVNHGTVLGVSSAAGVMQAAFSAANVFNTAGATITTVAPAQGVAGLPNLVSGLDLVLSATSQFVNAGIIASGGNLNLNAASLVNSGTIEAAAQANISATSQLINESMGQIAAQQALNINTATLVNSGLISSLASNIVAAGYRGAALSVVQNDGVLKALNGIVKVSSAGDLMVSGGTVVSNLFRAEAASGHVAIDVARLSAPVSIKGVSAQVNVAGGDLLLAEVDTSGDPLFSNSTGDVALASTISTSGAPLTVVAAGKIRGAAGGTTISTVGATNGGNVLMLAGAANSTVGGITSITGTSGLAGGIESINSIDTSAGGAGAGGAITLGTYSGTIVLGTLSAGSASGSAATIKIFAPGGLSAGAISSTGNHSAESGLTVTTSAPDVGAGLAIDSQGTVLSGTVAAGAGGSGGVSVGAINLSNTHGRGGALAIAAFDSISTGAITTSGGPMALDGADGGSVSVASSAGGVAVNGDIIASGGNGNSGAWASMQRGGNGGNGGAVAIQAAGNISAGAIKALGGGGGGGAGSSVAEVDAGDGGDGGSGGAVSLASSGTIVVGSIANTGGNGGGGGGGCCDGGTGGAGGTGGPNGANATGAMARGPLIGQFPYGTLPGGYYYGPGGGWPGGGAFGGGGAPGGWWGFEHGGDGGTGGSGAAVTLSAGSNIQTGTIQSFGGGSGGGGGMTASGGGGASGAYGGRGEDRIVAGDGIGGGAPTKYAGGGGGGFHYYPGYSATLYGGGTGGAADPANGGPPGGGGGGGWVLGGRGGGFGPTGYGGNVSITTTGGAVAVLGNIQAFSFSKPAGAVAIQAPDSVYVNGHIATDSGVQAGDVTVHTFSNAGGVIVSSYIDASSGGPNAGGDVEIFAGTVRVLGTTGSGASVTASGAGGIHGTINIATNGFAVLPTNFDLLSQTASVAALAGGLFTVGNASVNGTAGTIVSGSNVLNSTNGARILDGAQINLGAGLLRVAASNSTAQLIGPSGLVTVSADNGSGVRTMITPAQAIALYLVMKAGGTVGQTFALNASGQAVGTNPQNGAAAPQISLAGSDLPYGFSAFRLGQASGQAIKLAVSGATAEIGLAGASTIEITGVVDFTSAFAQGGISFGNKAFTLGSGAVITASANGSVRLSFSGTATWTVNGRVEASQIVIKDTQSTDALTINMGASAVLSGSGAGSALVVSARDLTINGGELRNAQVTTTGAAVASNRLVLRFALGTGANLGNISAGILDLALAGNALIASGTTLSGGEVYLRPQGTMVVNGNVVAGKITIDPAGALTLSAGSLLQASSGIAVPVKTSLVIDGTVSTQSLDFATTSGVSLSGAGLLTSASGLTVSPPGSLTAGIAFGGPRVTLRAGGSATLQASASFASVTAVVIAARTGVVLQDGVVVSGALGVAIASNQGDITLGVGSQVGSQTGSVNVVSQAGNISIAAQSQIAAAGRVDLQSGLATVVATGAQISGNQGVGMRAGSSLTVSGSGVSIVSTGSRVSLVARQTLDVGSNVTIRGMSGVVLRSLAGGVDVGQSAVVDGDKGTVHLWSAAGGIDVGGATQLSGSMLMVNSQGSVNLGTLSSGMSGTFKYGASLVAASSFNFLGAGGLLSVTSAQMGVTAGSGMLVGAGTGLAADRGLTLTVSVGNLTVERDTNLTSAGGNVSLNALQGVVALGKHSHVSAGLSAPRPDAPSELQVVRKGAVIITSGQNPTGPEGVTVDSGTAPQDVTSIESNGDRILVSTTGGGNVAIGSGAHVTAVAGNVIVVSTGSVDVGTAASIEARVALRDGQYAGGGIEIASGRSMALRLTDTGSLASAPVSFTVTPSPLPAVGSVTLSTDPAHPGGLVSFLLTGGGTMNLSTGGTASAIDVAGNVYGASFGSVYLEATGAGAVVRMNGAFLRAGQPVVYSSEGDAEEASELVPIGYMEAQPRSPGAVRMGAESPVHRRTAVRQAWLMPAPGSQYKQAEPGAIDLWSGIILVRGGNGCRVRTPEGDVYVRKGAVAIVEVDYGLCRAIACHGAPSLDVVAHGKHLQLHSGNEVAVLRGGALAPGDGIGRRRIEQTDVGSDVRFVRSEISIPTVLMSFDFLKPLRKASSVIEARIYKQLLKTAAALHVATTGHGAFFSQSSDGRLR